LGWEVVNVYEVNVCISRMKEKSLEGSHSSRIRRDASIEQYSISA